MFALVELSIVPSYRITREFDPERYENARHDGMAMERLQGSPYVLDIYGYCGVSTDANTYFDL